MSSRQIIITERNLGLWITIIMLLVGSIVDSVKIREQVKFNSKLLEKYPPEILFSNEQHMRQDVSEIKMEIKELRGELKDLAKTLNSHYRDE